MKKVILISIMLSLKVFAMPDINRAGVAEKPLSLTSFSIKSKLVDGEIAIPQNTKSLRAIAPLNIIVTSLCPKGAVCVTDGTRITLLYMAGCGNQIVDGGYKVVTTQDEVTRKTILTIYNSTLVLVSHDEDALRCFPSYQTKIITLPMVFVDEQDIQVHSLGIQKRM